jgi:ankyrin repeat protein
METADATANTEVERLKVVVADLTRRLKNAQLTIEAERTIAKNAAAQADLYRQQVGYMSQMLRLESAKSSNIEAKSNQQLEAKRFEENKEKTAEILQQLRIEEVDHWMTKNKKEPLRLQKMRAKLAKLESEQDSQKKIIQEMTEMESLNERLSTAAQLGHFDDCIDLLRHGAWVNGVDAAGYLPIHYACANGFYDIVKLCLEYGADHSSFLTGHSPVVVAASNGRTDIISLLLSFGADLEDKGSGKCPATIAAMMSGNFETFAFLINEAGADVNAFDVNENTALHLAVRLPDRDRSIQVILYLLEKGADAQRLNRKGHSAMQVALYDENKPAAHALGANFQTAEVARTTMVSASPSIKNTEPTAERSAGMTMGQASGKHASVDYLPKNIDSPVRASLNTVRGSSSSAKLLHGDAPAAAKSNAPHAALFNRSATASADLVQARRAGALSALMSSRRQPPIAAAAGDRTAPVLPQGSGAAAVRGVSAQNQAQYRPVQGFTTGAQTLTVSAAITGSEPPVHVLARESSLEGMSIISAESGRPHTFEEAAQAGMLDSQSVISAVTFGTAKVGAL